MPIPEYDTTRERYREPVTSLPAPGLHAGVPYAEYDLWPAARHSLLRLFNRTPAHAREAIEHPPTPTPALELGRAIHRAILEPQAFAEEYARAPKVDLRTSIGKHRWADFAAANLGKKVLTADSYAVCLGARESVWRHSTARQLLETAGLVEVSALWRDAETGLPCKARLDKLTALNGWSVILDLKSADNAGPRAFEREIHRWSYHQQAGFYIDGCDAITAVEERRERKYVFLVVEKNPPFAVACYELEPEAIQLGRDEYRKHLAEYALCLETGVWPAFDQGVGTISLPPWAFAHHGEQA
jgi:hypothetical protein